MNSEEEKKELEEVCDEKNEEIDESNSGFHAPWAALIVSGIIIILMIVCIIVIVNIK